MNPTTQSPSNSVHPARQQRILRLPEVKAKTRFGRRLPNRRWQPTTAQSQPARQHPPTHVLRERQYFG